MSKILISDSLDKIAKEIFEENNLDVDTKTNLKENEIIDIINNYDALIVRSATKVTKKIIDAASKLKVIGRAGAGVDNIDIHAAKNNNIIVMNTPGGNSNATAEHTLSLILSSIKNIPYANSTTHLGKWEKKNIQNIELSNKTIGIVGFGNVSKKLINLLKGFTMNILIYSKSYTDNNTEFPNVKKVSFEELISTSDIITLHSKGNIDSNKLLTYENFKNMKPTCILINTARGTMFDENDLNLALNNNLISKAALDVYSSEPAKSNILFNNPKVILTPHIAASTVEAQTNVAKMIAEQISNYLTKNIKINTV